MYDGEYEQHLRTLRGWLDRMDNLFTVGRNGQHRYNNQDHSMLTALYAVRNLAGARLDVWAVNEEESFHEEVRGEAAEGGVRDRLTPSPAGGGLDSLLREAFPHYDEVALGGAFGITATAVLTLATALLLRGAQPQLRADAVAAGQLPVRLRGVLARVAGGDRGGRPRRVRAGVDRGQAHQPVHRHPPEKPGAAARDAEGSRCRRWRPC
ncbi:MAG: hypothetical protein MZW92_28135 [Comamonadaceae bacterium]|nr:hypothetical protein [Comamonadaceae bacterium]